jgi:uncharacterized protein (TIGR03085 family)
MTQYARDERLALADLLDGVGPDEPTLCEGWTTRDLAAHLVIRDRRPDSALGVLIPAFAGHTERVRLGAAAKPFPELVEEVRNPPWWSPLGNPVVHELANALEFFVHHEDVRRGTAGWTPRVLDPGHQKAIWGAVKVSARLTLRKLHLPVAVRAPGVGDLRVGDGTPQATLVGEPGELALFLTGRQRAAQVDVQAPAELAERVRTAKLGL